MGEIRSAYKIVVWKPEGKKPCGRPSSRWEDNIEIDLREKSGRGWGRLIWLRMGSGHRIL
jgi:hypothetical protein